MSNVKPSTCVLGIESSCDETAVAVYDSARGLLAHLLHSQVALHAPYGGVVPELASRDHIRRCARLAQEVMQQSHITARDLDGIAYTAGPGLIGALLVGATVAHGLAYAWGIPALGVHHLEGHLLAPLLESETPEFPFLALLVSGGHTLLAEVRGIGIYRILGQSLDDAAGEAFDKTAKLLGLPYPGGPALAALAEHGATGRFALPRPMTDRPGHDFSFSGLKTAVLLAWQASNQDDPTRADLARAFQDAVVDTLVIKSLRALGETGLKRLVVAGGVGANRSLRRRMADAVRELGGAVYYPRTEFCTDNGAMVALTGSLRLTTCTRAARAIQIKPRWALSDLSPPDPT